MAVNICECPRDWAYASTDLLQPRMDMAFDEPVFPLDASIKHWRSCAHFWQDMAEKNDKESFDKTFRVTSVPLSNHPRSSEYIWLARVLILVQRRSQPPLVGVLGPLNILCHVSGVRFASTSVLG
jgi:hypothetical protein